MFNDRTTYYVCMFMIVECDTINDAKTKKETIDEHRCVVGRNIIVPFEKKKEYGASASRRLMAYLVSKVKRKLTLVR
jgi:hypothetical protein